LHISNSCISNIFNECQDIGTGEYNQVVVPGIKCFLKPGPYTRGLRSCFTSAPMKIKHVTEQYPVVC